MSILDAELAELVFEQMHGVIIVDTDARVIYINKQWADIIGIDRDESIGKPVKEVLPNTKMDLIVQTGKPMNSDLFELNGKVYVLSLIHILLDFSNAALRAIIPKSTGFLLARAPLKSPTGVRAPPTITTSCIANSPFPYLPVNFGFRFSRNAFIPSF